MSDVEDQPHALVKFFDGEKEVPISYISGFPHAWKRKTNGGGWDTNRLYKVFWSPDEKDSPRRMLTRVAEIPVFDKGVPTSGPGYYRAAVMEVKDSLQELQEFQLNHRISNTGDMLHKYTSFEAPSTSSKANMRPTKVTRQPCSSNEEQVKKPPQRKQGINKSAQRANTRFLGDSLSEIIPDVLKKTSKAKPSEDRVGIVTAPSSVASSPQKRLRPTRKLKYQKKAVPESSCSSEEDYNLLVGSNKKVKLDPAFTPIKYETLKADNEMNLATIKKVSSINEKLRAQLEKGEAERAELSDKVVYLEKELQELKEMRKRSTATNFLELAHDEGDANMSDDTLEATGECLNDGQVETAQKEGAAKGDTAEKVVQEPETLKQRAPLPEANFQSQVGQNQEMSEEVEIFPGKTVSAQLAKLIENIPPGGKKDLRFIKDLTIFAFGPEVLASRSIQGTRRGGRKPSSGEEKVHKPALDKQTLQSVKERFKERVCKEEGHSLVGFDEEKNDRTKTKRFHEAVRGAQKRCRLMGYGLGLKTNALSVSLFQD